MLLTFLLIIQPPFLPPPPGTQPLKYGDKVKESIIIGMTDEEENRVTLIVFFNPEQRIMVIFDYPFEEGRLAGFRKERDLTYPVFSTLDFAGILLPLPLTMVIDKNGKVLLIEYKDEKEEEIAREICKHIKEVR